MQLTPVTCETVFSLALELDDWWWFACPNLTTYRRRPKEKRSDKLRLRVTHGNARLLSHPSTRPTPGTKYVR